MTECIHRRTTTELQQVLILAKKKCIGHRPKSSKHNKAGRYLIFILLQNLRYCNIINATVPENQFISFFGLAYCRLLLCWALTTHLSWAFPSLAVITVLVKKKKKSEQFSQVSPGTTGHLGPPQTPHAATTITPTPIPNPISHNNITLKTLVCSTSTFFLPPKKHYICLKYFLKVVFLKEHSLNFIIKLQNSKRGSFF